MRFIAPLATLIAALVALLLTPAQTPILGMNHSDFARVSFGVAIVVGLVIAGVRRAGPGDISRILGGVMIWISLMLGLTVAYVYRVELGDVADRVMTELSPNEAQVLRPGEVVVKRRIGGEFVVPVKINDVAVPCLFDTGASSVVLRAQDAVRVGIDAAALEFDVSVVTANGAATAAQTRIDRMAIGGIVVRNVRALVAKPGALSESLLGMSFLERLDSYSVEHGRLVLKGK